MEKKIVAGFLLALIAFSRTALSAPSCPDKDLGETEADCPWAEISKKLIAEADAGKPVEPLLRQLAPKVAQQIDSDQYADTFKGMWGKSINFDELANGVIVHPAILDALSKMTSVAAREDRIVHAGVEHTYGYLFSTLKTPFGFKRARWVQRDIEKGFGLRANSLGATPEYGTLLQNLTYFAGMITFRDSGTALQKLWKERDWIDAALSDFKYEHLSVTRLEERVKVAGRNVTIRTELAAFPNRVANSKNTHLLVYSIDDPAANPDQPLLITAFPVETSFVENLLKKENLGDNKPVLSRYNAFVPGLTGANPPLTGSRRVYDR